MTQLQANAAEEIRSLHRAFMDLFTGAARDFSRCEAAFAPDFAMVGPDGRHLDRATIMKGLHAATAAPGFIIEIHDIRLVREAGDSVLLQYVEQQYRDGKTTRCRSSALFTAERMAPCGVVWRYLHETWMQDAG